MTATAGDHLQAKLAGRLDFVSVDAGSSHAEIEARLGGEKRVERDINEVIAEAIRLGKPSSVAVDAAAYVLGAHDWLGLAGEGLEGFREALRRAIASCPIGQRVVVEFSVERVDLTAADWGLLFERPGAEAIAQSLNAAFQDAVNRRLTPAQIRSTMHAMMSALTGFGANDRGPRQTLEELIALVYGARGEVQRIADWTDAVVSMHRSELPCPEATAFEVSGARDHGEALEIVTDPAVAEFWVVRERVRGWDGTYPTRVFCECRSSEDAYRVAEALAMTHGVPFTGLHITHAPDDWAFGVMASQSIPGFSPAREV